MKMTRFIKTMKIHYVLKGINENPCTKTMKKRLRQQKTKFGVYRSYTRIFIKSFRNVYRIQARRAVRGPPGSTIIILKEILRFNNNNNNNNHYPTIPWDGISRQGTPLGESLIPHFVGGIHKPKSLLLSPYPVIPPYVVRTPHPGFTDDLERITSYKS